MFLRVNLTLRTTSLYFGVFLKAQTKCVDLEVQLGSYRAPLSALEWRNDVIRSIVLHAQWGFMSAKKRSNVNVRILNS